MMMGLHATMHSFLDKIPDAPAIKSAAAVTVGSASGSVGAALAGWNWTSIIACATAIIGVAANVYFGLRRERRETQERHERSQRDIEERRERSQREMAESQARIAALNTPSGC